MKIKIIPPINSNPTRYKEFKIIAKRFKKLNNIVMASFQAKTGWEKPRKSEYKNYRSNHFQTDPY